MSKEPEFIVDEKTRRKNQVDSTYLRLRLKAKETRKKFLKFLVYIIGLSIFLAIGTYVSFQVAPIGAIFGIADVFMFIFGGFFLFLTVTKLFRPLTLTYSAVKNILEAIQTIDTLQEQIAYEDAYDSLNKALKNLTKLVNDRLIELDWYDKLNSVITEYVDDLELVLMPATFDRTIKVNDLEDYALALYSLDKEELLKVKQTINDRVSKEIYKRTEISTNDKQWKTWKRFSENKIGKLTISVFLGYGLVLLLCGVYVFATQQDFMTFARDRPDVVVIGGLIASGITFWRENKK